MKKGKAMKNKILILATIFICAFGLSLVAQELPMIPDDIKVESNWNKIVDKYKSNVFSSRKLYAIPGGPFEFVLVFKYENGFYSNICVYTDCLKFKIIGIDYTLFYREKDFSSDGRKKLEKDFKELKNKYCKNFEIPAGRRSFVDSKYCVDIRTYDTEDNSVLDERKQEYMLYPSAKRPKYKSAYKGIRFFITKRYNSIYMRETKLKFDLYSNNGFEFIDIIDEENE